MIQKNQTAITRNLLWFFVITFAWSWLLWLPGILSGYDFEVPDFLLFIGMFAPFGPFVAAFALTGKNEGWQGIKALLKRGISCRFEKKWFIPIVLLTPAIAALAFTISRLIYGDTTEPVTLGILPTLIAMFFIGGPLNEEFGWRGYALDRLQTRYNALVSSLILGGIWGLWHLPLHFAAGTTQEYIPIWAGILMIGTSSIFYTWLHNNTGGSVLVAMLFHWFGNMAAILFPYWQAGIPEGTTIQLPNLWVPTPGMLIGFGISVVVAVAVVIFSGKDRFIRRQK